MFRRIFVIEQVRVGEEERYTLQVAGPREEEPRRWVFRSSEALLRTLRTLLTSPQGKAPETEETPFE